MRKSLFTLAALFSLSAPCIAAEIDLENSSITWTGSKITGSQHTGTISPKSSDISVADGSVQSGSIVFDMDTITVTDLEGKWATKFLTHMKSEDFFNVAKFPTATLEIKENASGKMKGDLTIMGVSQPFSFDAQREDGKYVGKTSFDRTKFGITYGSGNFFQGLGDKVINDTVEVSFVIALSGE